jgi:2-keto-3-deoxy-L-rhamnonate aldolase RhmA
VTINRIIEQTQAAGIAPGIHNSDLQRIGSQHEQGVRFIAYASDIEFIYNGALQGVQALQEKQP